MHLVNYDWLGGSKDARSSFDWTFEYLIYVARVVQKVKVGLDQFVYFNYTMLQNLQVILRGRAEMGLGLAKAKSEVWAYVQPGAVVGVTPGGIQGTVQPGAVTGIAPGGVLAAVQPGAVTGIEPGGITVNLSTGGALITGVIVIFASLYFLSLMPHEVTYLMILVVSALAVSNSKYFIIAAVTAFCLIATYSKFQSNV